MTAPDDRSSDGIAKANRLRLLKEDGAKAMQEAENNAIAVRKKWNASGH